MERIIERSQAKKLIGAAELWVRGAPTDQPVREDAAAFGIVLPNEPEPEPYKVLPEAWQAVQMFIRMGTQWRSGHRGVIGLDYRVLEWLLSLYPADDPQTLLEDLQIMEAAALQAIHQQAE